MKTAKTLLSLVICGIVLAGCGDDGEKKAPSQVLAKVNDKSPCRS
jgi:nitrous oxide reductase accessory protein NosL